MKESCKSDVNQSVPENILSRPEVKRKQCGRDRYYANIRALAFINNYSTLSEERHKKISNILSNTETNRNALVPVQFSANLPVKPPQILQPVALLMFRVEVIQICQAKLVLCFT